MINEVQTLLDQYWAWLKDKTTIREIDQWVEITTPYLDRHNDYVQIYAKRKGSGFVLTDDSYILEDLELSGCKIDSNKRKDLLNQTLNGFGVKANDKALVVDASKENFALQKHNLVQAMLAVNDLFYLAKPLVASIFLEDVTTWLDVSNIRYTPKIKLTGKSGYDHMFDFIIPKSLAKPERILRAINRPGRDTAQAIAFSWIDTREVRPPESRAFAILNDTEKDISESVLDAMRNYDVHPVLWSQRSEIHGELTT